METSNKKPATNRQSRRNVAKKDAQAVVILPAIEPAKEVEQVKVKFRVTQCGKNPFSMETTVQAPANKVTVSGLANKTAFALMDSLYNLVERSLQAKKDNGYYLTSFRPKAVFKIEVITDNNISFMAMNTKGTDSIRMIRKDKIISKSVLVQKLGLLASATQANNSFAQSVSFIEHAEQLVISE